VMDALIQRGRRRVRMVNRSGRARVPEGVEVAGGDATDEAFALRSVSGPIPATIRVLLESPDGARTKVILVGEVQLRGIYKPMELVMRWVAQRQFGTQLRTLKNLLESEPFR
jgi:hypothetical protein